MLVSPLFSAIAFGAIVNAHFILLEPTNLGFDDDAEVVSPCGGFNASSRANVTEFPISGGVIGLLSTHSPVTFEFQAALVSDLTKWTNITPKLNQTGSGYYCNTQVPGLKGWEGKDAVLRVVQHGAMEDMPDMMEDLYQCAAIRFTNATRTGTPSSATCKNSTGITTQWV